MTHELIGELYRRYMRGDLTLEEAAEQIHTLMRDHEAGLSVFTGDMSPADQDRTLALLGRLQWHAIKRLWRVPFRSFGEFLRRTHGHA